MELCFLLYEFLVLSNVEHLYTRYKHSIPSTMSECKSQNTLHYSIKIYLRMMKMFELSDIAQVELELYILCQILGIG